MRFVLRYVFKGVVKENVVFFINCHSYSFSPEGKMQCLNYKNSAITLEPEFTEDILGKAIIFIFEDLN